MSGGPATTTDGASSGLRETGRETLTFSGMGGAVFDGFPALEAVHFDEAGASKGDRNDEVCMYEHGSSLRYADRIPGFMCIISFGIYLCQRVLNTCRASHRMVSHMFSFLRFPISLDSPHHLRFVFYIIFLLVALGHNLLNGRSSTLLLLYHMQCVMPPHVSHTLCVFPSFGPACLWSCLFCFVCYSSSFPASGHPAETQHCRRPGPLGVAVLVSRRSAGRAQADVG